MNDSHDEELLSAYLDGELTAEEQARVERRLADDSGYRQLHDELRAVRQHLESIPPQKLPADFSQTVLAAAERQMIAPRRSGGDEPAAPLAERRWVRPLTWTALIAAAAVLVMIFSPSTQQRSNLAKHDAEPGAPQTQPPASATSVTGNDTPPPAIPSAEMRAAQDSADSLNSAPANKDARLADGDPATTVAPGGLENVATQPRKSAPAEAAPIPLPPDAGVTPGPAFAPAPAAPIPAAASTPPSGGQNGYRAVPAGSSLLPTAPKSEPAAQSLDVQSVESEPSINEQAEKGSRRLDAGGDGGGGGLGDRQQSIAGTTSGGPPLGSTSGKSAASAPLGSPAGPPQARSAKVPQRSAYDEPLDAPRGGHFAREKKQLQQKTGGQPGLTITGSIAPEAAPELNKWVRALKPQHPAERPDQQGQTTPLAAKTEPPAAMPADAAPRDKNTGKQGESADVVYRLDLTYDAMIDLLARMRSRPDLYQLDPLDPTIEKAMGQRTNATAKLMKEGEGRGPADAEAGKRKAGGRPALAGPARDTQEEDGKLANLKQQKAGAAREEKQAVEGWSDGQLGGQKGANDLASDKYKKLESDENSAAATVYRVQIVLRRAAATSPPAAASQERAP